MTSPDRRVTSGPAPRSTSCPPGAPPPGAREGRYEANRKQVLEQVPGRLLSTCSSKREAKRKQRQRQVRTRALRQDRCKQLRVNWNGKCPGLTVTVRGKAKCAKPT